MTIALPRPGVYHGVPAVEYHSWPYASNSALSELFRSPAHLEASRAEEWKETPAQRLGTAIHARVIEPAEFAKVYAKAGQCEWRKKDGDRCSREGTWNLKGGGKVCTQHAKDADAQAPRPGTIVLKLDEWNACEGINASIEGHAIAGPLLELSEGRELSIVWDDPITGVRCKARLDLYSKRLASISDLKSAIDGEPLSFERAILKWGYHRKAWFYLRGAKECGLEATNFPIITAEKKPPYAVDVYRLSDGVVSYLEDQISALLELYAVCQARGDWPTRPQTVREISIPKWGWVQIDEQTEQLRTQIEYVRSLEPEEVHA